jgi:membrane fusion protein (multidrug efflux system)
MIAYLTSRATRTIVLGGAMLLSLAACRKQEAAADETVKPVVAARTVKATIEPFTRTMSAIGSVVARPGRFAALSAPSPTRVTKVYVSAGQRVAAGQPLVEFDQAPFNAAAAAAEAALRTAERNHERALRLANEGIVPRKDAEQAAADLARARNDAVTARRAQQLSVLRSPVTGVVTKMSAVLGAPADPATVLVEIADPSAFDVVLSVSPTEAADVHQGSSVALSSGEKAGGDALGTGTVASVGAALDSTSRSVAIRVMMGAPRRPLRMGESVFGEIAVERRPNAVVVPVQALVPDPDGYKVYVVDKDGTAIGRIVKVGGRTETKAEILAGLKGGETIVSQGAYAVEDSAKVTMPGTAPAVDSATPAPAKP